MSLARRNLFQDKTRLALSVGGVALAVMLIVGYVQRGRIAAIYAWPLSSPSPRHLAWYTTSTMALCKSSTF
jgi:hypothetical protein